MTPQTSADLPARVASAASFLERHGFGGAEIVTVLGSGQELLPAGLEVGGEIDYAAIPNFPSATGPGHRGRLLYGSLAGRACLILQGRFHWYEGYELAETTLPIRVAAALGAKVLVVTNTAGGLNPDLAAGDLMAISDHLNFLGGNPLRGLNHAAWGPRFPDLSAAYSKRLLALARQSADRLGLRLASGVYVAVPGPSLETPAETRFLRQCGADAVGMSTVPEVIVAVQAGLEVFGLSVIANVNDPDHMQPIVIDEVIHEVQAAAGRTGLLLGHLLRQI